MTESIPAMTLRKNLGEILNRVVLRKDRFIIERSGRPMAAMIPVDEYARLQELARRSARRLLDRARSGGDELTGDEAWSLADEARRAVRRSR